MRPILFGLKPTWNARALLAPHACSALHLPRVRFHHRRSPEAQVDEGRHLRVNGPLTFPTTRILIEALIVGIEITFMCMGATCSTYTLRVIVTTVHIHH